MMHERTYDMKRYTHIFMNSVRTIALTPYYDRATEWNVNFLLAATVPNPFSCKPMTVCKKACRANEMPSLEYMVRLNDSSIPRELSQSNHAGGTQTVRYRDHILCNVRAMKALKSKLSVPYASVVTCEQKTNMHCSITIQYQ